MFHVTTCLRQVQHEGSLVIIDASQRLSTLFLPQRMGSLSEGKAFQNVVTVQCGNSADD